MCNQIIRRGIIKFIFFFSLSLITTSPIAMAANWQNVADGIQYKKIVIEYKTETEKPYPPGIIHLFQIDPLKFKFDIITAKQLGMRSVDAKIMAQKSNAVIAINGGFFSPEYTSLGLIVQNGKEINKLKWTSWWHIFQIRKTKPEVITKHAYQLTHETEMAIEAGPRLVVAGNIPEGLKPSISERTAIGTTADGQVIIAVTENYPVSMFTLSGYLMKEGCYDALNLDGGSSTQLYAKFKGLEINRPGFGPVANGVGVFPR